MENKFINESGLLKLIQLIKDYIDKKHLNNVTGVKGNNETNYRTGNVNITKSNIGLSEVDNTSDVNKPISNATQLALDLLVVDIDSKSFDKDPTVPDWVKSPTKPEYTASEVGALPDDTFIPTKISDLENDGGLISTETDPTVPSWAKQPNKPTYTASEVGALPDTTEIPSKTSDLVNDSGYLTLFTEADPIYSASAAAGISTSDIDNWNNKQNTLVSGTTIKTINSQSVLGGGDIAVATPTDLSTYCPIIEDTRSSAVAAITGNAPFSSLANGQRILLHVHKTMQNGSTLELTYPNGTTTGAIAMWASSVNAAKNTTFGTIYADTFWEFVYDSTNAKWVMVGQRDTNTTYNLLTQALIDAGTEQAGRLISAKLLHDNFQKHTAIETLPSGAIAPTDGYEPNKMYDFGKVASVTFATYDTSKEIANAVNLYMCTFVVASGGTTLRLNANIKYPNGDDGTELTNLLTTEDRVFEITIRDNKLSYLYFD